MSNIENVRGVVKLGSGTFHQNYNKSNTMKPEDQDGGQLIQPINPNCTRCLWITQVVMANKLEDPAIGWKCTNCYAFYKK